MTRIFPHQIFFTSITFKSDFSVEIRCSLMWRLTRFSTREGKSWTKSTRISPRWTRDRDPSKATTSRCRTTSPWRTFHSMLQYRNPPSPNSIKTQSNISTFSDFEQSKSQILNSYGKDDHMGNNMNPLRKSHLQQNRFAVNEVPQFEIVDFSPEWDYTTGGAKLLVCIRPPLE